MKKHILFVDDEQLVLDSLRRVLRSQRHVWEATLVDRADAAWERLLESPFDAVVSDIRMPGMGGLELLERIQRTKQTANIPVVMLTGVSDRELKRQALDLGAADLLNKPVEPEDLLARLRSVLRLKSYQDELKAHSRVLEQKVHERTLDSFNSQLDILWRLGKVAEYRDKESSNHVIRVACISRLIAEVFGMDGRTVETLFLAAPLHDIGKIGIPDAVLLKKGPLSPGEWAVMKRHCQIGARILREDSPIRAAFFDWRGLYGPPEAGGSRNAILETAATVALAHHEKWDGSGYPQGLVGEEIPREARIVAIADVFDALMAQRPYKPAYLEAQALEILDEESERHFDPAVYEAFMDSLAEVRVIRERFADGPKDLPEQEEAQDETNLVRG